MPVEVAVRREDAYDVSAQRQLESRGAVLGTLRLAYATTLPHPACGGQNEVRDHLKSPKGRDSSPSEEVAEGPVVLLRAGWLLHWPDLPGNHLSSVGRL